MEQGIYRSEVRFPHAALQGYSWPTVEIVGHRPGPKLAVIAGIHVNETSSIEAAIRLQGQFDPSSLIGRVSIMPVVNLPAIPLRTQYFCPLDGKNINFSFPGKADGTFAEAMAHAILSDWAHDADCLADMHGGDLCENVAHFTICQTVGDAEFDARNMAIASCFDSELIVRLDPGHLDAPGRSCTGRAASRRHAAFSEAGRIGLIEEKNVLFHFEGILRVAALFGMIAEAPPRRRVAQVVERYHWVPAPVDGFYRYRVEAGQRVARGMVLAIAENSWGEEVARVLAPADGWILWSLTHAFVEKDSFMMGVGA